MSNPILSIIIPVFNGEDYIDKCLSSLIKEDLKDETEVILVDNASTDDSYSICERWKDWAGNVILYQEEHKGASNARNLGIQKARGKYLTFVDIDDYLLESFRDVVKLLERIDTDVVIAEATHSYLKVSKGLSTHNFSGNSGIKECFEKGLLINTAPHAKFFKNELVQRNRILFPLDVIVGEDAVFFFDFLSKAKSITYVNTPIYVYQDNASSIIHRAYPVKQEWIDYCEMRKSLLSFCKLFQIDNENDFKWSILTSRLRRYMKVCIHNSKDIRKDLTKIPYADTAHYGQGQRLSVGGKVFSLLVRHRLFTLVSIIGKLRNTEI